MATASRSHEQLEAENLRLRAELEEVRETLEAIRSGRVDALVVERPDGDEVYVLSNADRPYRALVEDMQEGALVLRQDGCVLFCNRQAAELLHSRPDILLGSSFQRFLSLGSIPAFEAMLREGIVRTSRVEVELMTANGGFVSAQLSARRMPVDGLNPVSVIVTDLTHQKRSMEIMASQRLANAVIDQAVDAIVICDVDGTIIRANLAAHRLCGGNPLFRSLSDSLPLYRAKVPETVGGSEPSRLQIAASDGPIDGAAATFSAPGGRQYSVRISASPLRNAEGALQGFVVTLVDITQSKQAEESLRQLRDLAERRAAEAQAANEAKTQFLANVSHELRTPMNAILGMIDLARRKQQDPLTKDFLDTARESADILLALLNDLLDSAKIESGKLELEAAPFRLRRILDQLTRALAVRAGEKALAFHCRVPDDLPDALIGDEVRLRQVLMNLAGNAIKFTELGEVEVAVRVDSLSGEEATLEFAVRDTGIGIPQGDLERIFKPFAQADASTARRFGGTGLGLSISANLVAMMGGRLWAQSEPGQGSTFRFTVCFPLAKEMPPDQKPAVDITATPARKLRILLVEDNPANQKLAAYILGEAGHTVEVAGDGQQALNMTGENRYDLILMDVQMPGMDGLATTAALRARDKQRGPGEGSSGHRRHVPIIAMTAHAMRGDRERFLTAGMDGYLSKPINVAEMFAAIERLTAASDKEETAAGSLASNAVELAAGPAQVFDLSSALERCCQSRQMLGEMTDCLFAEIQRLFPRMQDALARGDLAEVGRLGHRLKGTLVYLGAQPAVDAAWAVERCADGDKNQAVEAVRILERKVDALQQAIAGYRTDGGKS